MKPSDDKDAEEKKGSSAGNGSSPPGPSPFERFEEFARKVVSVPRATIEERERAYRESRKPKPERD